MRKCSYDSALDGNSMLVDLVVEGFAQRDHVAFALVTMILLAGIEPEPRLIKKVEAMPVNEARAGGMTFSAEADSGREDALEAFDGVRTIPRSRVGGGLSTQGLSITRTRELRGSN